MHEQVGDLVLDEDGLAMRGLLVRHLVLPGGFEDTRIVLTFLAEKISKFTYLNLMDQYRPRFRAAEFPPLDRSLRREEFDACVAEARRLGIHRLDGLT